MAVPFRTSPFHRGSTPATLSLDQPLAVGFMLYGGPLCRLGVNDSNPIAFKTALSYRNIVDSKTSYPQFSEISLAFATPVESKGKRSIDLRATGNFRSEIGGAVDNDILWSLGGYWINDPHLAQLGLSAGFWGGTPQRYLRGALTYGNVGHPHEHWKSSGVFGGEMIGKLSLFQGRLSAQAAARYMEHGARLLDNEHSTLPDQQPLKHSIEHLRAELAVSYHLRGVELKLRGEITSSARKLYIDPNTTPRTTKQTGRIEASVGLPL